MILKDLNNFLNKINLLNIPKNLFFSFISSINLQDNYNINFLFKKFFPIKFSENVSINYIDYHFIKPKYDPSLIKLLNKTFQFYLFLSIHIECITKNNIINIYKIIYLGKIPFMLKNGNFLINGDEKVLISKLQRNDGIYFFKDECNVDHLKNRTFVQIIPSKGSWLEFEINYKNIIYVKINQSKKFSLGGFLLALNFDLNQILNIFQEKYLIFCDINYNFYIQYSQELFFNELIPFDLFYKNKIFFKKNNIFSYCILQLVNKLNIKFFQININDFINYKIFDNINFDNIVIEKDTYIDIDIINILKKYKLYYFYIYKNDLYNNNLMFLLNTFEIEKNANFDEANLSIQTNIFKKHHFNKDIINDLFFNINNYELSKIGRFKINKSIKNNISKLTLDITDIILILKKLIYIKLDKLFIDDVDHLSNKIVKSINQLMYYQFNLILTRIINNFKKKNDFKKLMDSVIITNSFYDFFNVNALCQFLDQTNILSECTHKRKLTVLGDGLTNTNINFEMRDINHSYYGKICPIETPEGSNIGLVNSFAYYTKIDKNGLISTPYLLVLDGYITNIVHYINTLYENNLIIAQYDCNWNKSGFLLKDKLLCRYNGFFEIYNKYNINYMDISSKQIISISASLIPFLEHNDANRALMGCNMQKQAVPLLFADRPLILTGTEKKIIYDSFYNVYASNDGVVKYVDSKFICIKELNGFNQIYILNKYSRSNQNTLIHHKVKINLNDFIKKGDLLAESVCSNLNNLALGKNFKVAFMPYEGYNFEDAILVSEKIIQNDMLTSLHVHYIECYVRYTKYGFEETTNDINCDENHILKLDKNGIIKIGSNIKEGDILVGKITPIEQVIITPEQKLLFSIFKKKIKKMKDSSLKVPKGISGVVSNIDIIYKKLENNLEDLYNEDYQNWINICQKFNISNIDAEQILNLPFYIIKIKYPFLISFENEYKNFWKNNYYINYKNINYIEDKNLDINIVKIIKIKIISKKILKVGDKLSGRYGNKGVISKICPLEDMPYDINGNIVDIILNPLGIPSRMNIGQLFEVYLSKNINDIKNNILYLYKQKLYVNLAEYLFLLNKEKYINFNINNILNKNILELKNFLNNNLIFNIIPFDGLNANDILKMSEKFNIKNNIYLYDGRSGLRFKKKITIGIMYLMKLNHLVEDKIHARSIGTYSLITQQPMGGKSNFGGQRLGEMEVWALEAYGSAFLLQEMLTIKSDDIIGRSKLYKSLIIGNKIIKSNLTESFNILLNEIRSLCLNIDLIFDN